MKLMVDDKQLDYLVKEFVNIYARMKDLNLDVFSDPPLWFMPIETNQSRKEAAKYFLLAAALLDTEVTGNSRNVRVLLDDFHDVFGPRLYSISDPKMLEVEVQKCQSSFEFFDQMGPRKNEIPRIVSKVNAFIQEKAQNDVIEYAGQLAKKGKKPIDLFEELCLLDTERNPSVGKFWIYLRWMTRKSPDLALFDFGPEDLRVPLTAPTLSFVASRELVDNSLSQLVESKGETTALLKNSKTVNYLEQRLNDYAKTLFPDDPAKVDFPFYVLGKWLTGFKLNKECLEKTLRFFIEKYYKIGTWPVRYLVERRQLNKYACDFNIGAQSQMEIPVAEFLIKNNVRFEFEPLQFWWAKEHGIVAIDPPYTPDFLVHLRKCFWNLTECGKTSKIM